MTGLVAGLRARYETVPARLTARPAGRFFHALVQEIGDDDVFGMAAEMAYRLLFAMFPLFLFLVATLGFVGDTLGLPGLFDRLLHQVVPLLPDPVSEILRQYVEGLLETRSTAFLTVGALGTLWGAAGGAGTLIKGLNRAYDVEEPRAFWHRQAVALGVTITILPMGLALLAVAILGRRAAVWLGDALGLGSGTAVIIAAARWPVLALVLILGLSYLYHTLPNIRHRYVWSLPGSVFAAAGWVLLVQGFGLYIASAGNFDVTYGAFGAAMAFLLWLYFTGVVVLLGAEINALMEPSRRGRWLSPEPPRAEADACSTSAGSRGESADTVALARGVRPERPGGRNTKLERRDPAHPG